MEPTNLAATHLGNQLARECRTVAASYEVNNLNGPLTAKRRGVEVVSACLRALEGAASRQD